ncbi:hypothetical protein EOE67_16805 [Rheinheimera riviphila]|uniref:Uncharacterized protein n=1 Tax=Rheinheimera riviphila TaxID=1834037 RepID=A0A437QG25_9GAMM|nr:hypothetical protein [Rheinheimera riviphila]RVU33384.1 hypothetical protein EOE67_16805 [Rheinheimera riviphila]
MSLIHVIEQLGTNAALQQLSQAQLMAMFSDAATDKNQLEALLQGNVEALSELLEVPVYRCVTEHPAEEEEQPVEQEEQPTKQSVHFQ